jgi:predicted metalloprotease
MRLDEVEESSNVEDRRGSIPKGGAIAGGGIGLLVIVIIVSLLGGDPQQVIDASRTMQAGAPQSKTSAAPINDEAKMFVSKILKETEDVWTDIFRENGMTYQKPNLVVFADRVESGCGIADAGVGPFYCPADSKVYIDPTFYETMERQLGAGGDFAQAYVVAHEVGHHVQNLLGTAAKVDSARRRMSEKQFNQISVRMELQADFYAGVWAKRAKRLKLDRQDIEEAMNAATQIGDDTLQQRGQGYVEPEKFTHGTSAQRVRWFMKGYQSGDIRDGDTISARSL